MAREETTVPLIDKNKAQLISDISQWTRQDTLNRLSISQPKDPFLAKSRKQHIYLEDLPGAWKKYQNLRNIMTYESGLKNHRIDKSLVEKTSRMALTAASLARTAFVLAGVEQGTSIARANDIAGFEITKYGVQLIEKAATLPPYRLLDMPLEDAVDVYCQGHDYGKIQPTMRSLIGLSTIALIEYGAQKHDVFILPEVAQNSVA